jgi:hypothetical protein
MKGEILGKHFLESTIFAEGVELLGGGVVERIEVYLPCRGDGFEAEGGTHATFNKIIAKY